MSNEESADSAIVVVEHGNLLAASTGRELVERATERATALADVVRKQKLSTKISGREHVRVEGWTLLGSMMGVFPVTDWVHELRDKDGNLLGFEARVAAQTLAGATVGAAIARCVRSERNWTDRDEFALMSMAQTRATSKALRMPLGFVMQLAGFDPTPAEEMPKGEQVIETQIVAVQATDNKEADVLRAKLMAAVQDGKVSAAEAQKAAEGHGVGSSDALKRASADVLRSLMKTLGLTEDEPPPDDTSTVWDRLVAAAARDWTPSDKDAKESGDPVEERRMLLLAAAGVAERFELDEDQLAEIGGFKSDLADLALTSLRSAVDRLEAFEAQGDEALSDAKAAAGYPDPEEGNR